jgi:hypothetical protein
MRLRKPPAWVFVGVALSVNTAITAANYRMVSMALNAFGVQIDPGDERMPAQPRR